MVSRGSPVVMHSVLSSCPMQKVPALVVVADMVEYLWILGAATRNSIKKMESMPTVVDSPVAVLPMGVADRAGYSWMLTVRNPIKKSAVVAGAGSDQHCARAHSVEHS